MSVPEPFVVRVDGEMSKLMGAFSGSFVHSHQLKRAMGQHFCPTTAAVFREIRRTSEAIGRREA